VQGFTYRDWYLLVYEKNRAAEIYARWAPVGSATSRSEA
jgi:hypothetical protein